MKALDLAAHIINRSMDLGAPVTNLKLQKMLYVLEIKSLVHYGKSLIDENFEAQDYGPFLKNVYDKYSYFAACDINVRQEVKEKLPGDQKNAILNDIDDMAHISGWDLVVLSMQPNTPWAKTFKENETREIPKQLMADYAKTIKDEMNKVKEIHKDKNSSDLSLD